MTILSKLLAITQLPKLTKLNLSSERITPVLARVLCKFLPKLEELELPSCHMEDNTITILQNLKYLTKLNISRNRLTEAGCAAIAKFECLNSLDICKAV